MVIKLFLEPSLDVGCTQVIKFFFGRGLAMKMLDELR